MISYNRLLGGKTEKLDAKGRKSAYLKIHNLINIQSLKEPWKLQNSFLKRVLIPSSKKVAFQKRQFLHNLLIIFLFLWLSAIKNKQKSYDQVLQRFNIQNLIQLICICKIFAFEIHKHLKFELIFYKNQRLL